MTLCQTSESLTRCPRTRAARWGLVGVGLLCVGLGALGVFVPGLPTTIFLIVASWCFLRSCPWLERRLIRESRLFAPFVRYLEPGVRMPLRARVTVMVIMWTAVTISLVTLLRSTELAPAVYAVPIIGAALIGSVCVARYGRGVGETPSAEPTAA